MTMMMMMMFSIGHASHFSSVFYWQSVNLIGSPAIFYSPIENNRARMALKAAVVLDFWLKST